ncbi:MAG: hypothetical protein LBQ44_05470, partial [Treponema sp.]|nr:hypothetical protein [Treponema sp.]
MDKVYLFRQNNILVPETFSPPEAAGGVDSGLAAAAFGEGIFCRDKVPLSGDETGGAGEAFLLDSGEPLPPLWKALSLREAAAALSRETGSLVCAGAETENAEIT